MRHYVVGDIHGHSIALKSILDRIQLNWNDRITFLGDYVDRGPDSKGVLDLIMTLPCQVDALMGNHEALLLASLEEPDAERHWLHYGGDTTLASFGVTDVHCIPTRYLSWMAERPTVLETESAIFVHASLHPDLPVSQQSEEHLLWQHVQQPVRHTSGKRVFRGHTPLQTPIVTPHWVSLDTGISHAGYLTCLEIKTGAMDQSDRFGQPLSTAA